MIVRDQPATTNSDHSFEHMRQEDKMWELCLTLKNNPYDPDSAQTLK